LYFAVFGIGTFCGNLTSVAFIGDFSAIADTLALPMALRRDRRRRLRLADRRSYLGRKTVAGIGAGHCRRVAGTLAMIVVPYCSGRWPSSSSISQRQSPRARAEGFCFAAIGAIGTKRLGRAGRKSGAPLTDG
jgi:hypothetical protein